METYGFVSALFRSGSGLALLLLASLVAASTVHAAEPTNPHWRKSDCQACHEATQPTAEQAALKATSGQDVCSECHSGRSATICRHRSDITPSPERTADFDEALQNGIKDGKIVCITCHDMAPHCALDVQQRYRNTSFLRGGPYENRGDECFACHNKSGYRQRTPHMHISKGKIKEGACAFCHDSVPQKDSDGQWTDIRYGTDGPLSQLCTGCHMIGPHPSGSVTGKTGWIHMIAPPWEYAQRMEQTVAERGGSLPLDPHTGAITCTTCHNPHDRRLESYPWAGEKTKTRLRYENMCGVCHEK